MTILGGKLEQACPCGRWEAAGRYCTSCGRPTGPADWYANGDEARRLEALSRPTARSKGGVPGRSGTRTGVAA